MENRRWNRIFRLQTEVHTKLIDRFGNNQELLTYMDTEAGKRFLEAAPIPVNFDRTQQPARPHGQDTDAAADWHRADAARHWDAVVAS